MASPNTIGDTVVAGSLAITGSFSPPAGSIQDNAVKAGATGNYIQATKTQHQAPGVIGGSVQLFGPTTAVVAVTQTLGMAKGAGTLGNLDAWTEVIATGADRTITVDLQKSTGAGAYATVLSATAGFTNVSPVRTAVAGTFSSTAYVAGDIFRLVVTVAGAAGAQATGLTVRIVTREEPQ